MKKIFFIIPLCILFFFNLYPSKDSIIYVRTIDSESLEPGKADDYYSDEVISNIFEGLVRFKKGTLIIEPCLATTWEIKDNGKRWIFKLRKEVKFHNGEIFDARAVVKSFKRRMGKSKSKYKKWEYLFSYIKDITSIDRYTVEIVLNKAYALFLSTLADPGTSIVAPGCYKGSCFKPIGTGPFKFEKRKKGKYLIIKRNEFYWEGKIELSKVTYKIVKNACTELFYVKNNIADVSKIGSAKEYEEFKGNKRVRFIFSPSFRIHYLAFNIKKEPFNKVEVRRAFCHLIDKKMLIKHVFQNLAITAVTPIPPYLFGFNKKIVDYDYNIEKVKELLKKSGLENGFECSLFYTKTNIALNKIVNILIKNARPLNIIIKKTALPFNEMRNRINRGEHDMVIMGWIAGPDPDVFLYPTLTMKKGNKNRAFYDNPKLTSILEEARETLQKEKRIKLYERAQEIIHNDVPWNPLYHLKSIIVCNKKVKNLYIDSNGYLIFKNATKIK